MVDTAGITLDDLSGPGAAAVLARLRADSPVAWIPVLRGWLVTSHETAVAVMRDATTFTVDDPGFSTARVVGPSMLSTDGAEHLRHRRPFGYAFRPSQLSARFGPPVSELATELIARMKPHGRAELRSELAGPLAVGVVAAALGLDAEPSTVLGWYAAIVGAVTDITAGTAPNAAAAVAMADLDLSVRAAHGEGLLSEAGQALSPSEVTSNAAVLMFGGIDTTEGMILNALLHLLGRPTPVRRDQLGQAIEESLRLEPAASVVDRYATADSRLGGATIARGDLVRVSLLAANRDPAVFLNPDVFDPTRTGLEKQVAFARGPHTCLAMDLARLETRVAIEAVLDGLPGVHLAGPAAATGLVFRKPMSLPVTWPTSADLMPRRS